jgi:hypothetical protein
MIGVVVGGSGSRWGGVGNGGDGGIRFGDFEILKKWFYEMGGKRKSL